MSREELNRRIGVTEEQLDKEAEEYENDTWDASKFGKVVMGRPSLADEEVKPITFRLPVSKIAALDRRAAREGRTRSEELRLAVDDRLMKA
ncbi:ribbon-helix-helix protein, CopG family [Gordonibacter massiliensis (ex Traore et al. 2017)]|uniref:Ribbon-helix-helix protein, CopG family n=1 Tax=Gordonibacter massiliensis (ex Traore et al. 2017) TaxID=1841863 RepID=A0A842J9H3_9ACTN|nr:ribbon-helix-helix protein, CopG family [Gordonibacter massiliensis (ex Traore et al. 2017)]MBC2888443.1 ribbon-helix-helix protein, CopG family [Gordonibacter massiliensis (ex Traore et al. 2017)]